MEKQATDSLNILTPWLPSEGQVNGYQAVIKAELILENISEFPTLPTIYSSLADALADPCSTTRDVSRIISCDQASTSKILKIVNSPLYGYPGQIDTVSRAIVVLGYNEISNLVLTSQIMDLFSKRESLLDFRPVDFWGHSIAVGIATRHIGKALGLAKQDNFFTAGVLHDIGKLVFFEFASDQFTRALEWAKKHRLPIQAAEWEIFGTDHAYTGALLAEKWLLPQSIVQALRFHETGIAPETDPKLIASVHLGNALVRALELGYPGDDLILQPKQEALDILKLEPGILTQIVPNLLKDYEEITRILL
jgi:putative nucleotidyltransferase with HDIG domain